MAMSCVPASGPYVPHLPAFTTAAPDEWGRHHIVDPRTDSILCYGGPGRASKHIVRCSETRGLYLGRSRPACEVPYAERCFDIRCWPRHVPRPDRPIPKAWPDSRPPDWYVWWALYPLQSERCALCQVAPAQVIDHDHGTGLVRGLLCRDCNQAESAAARRVVPCPHTPGCFEEYWTSPPASSYGWIYRSHRRHT